MTLANFNYRKMTLVRDYNDLIAAPACEHANFDLLFSEEARRAFEPTRGEKHDDYMVLPADPSQAKAVARASGGESYVIQGPPGTGKSQTITNLIADYVARGKGVLFVCEKRAALGRGIPPAEPERPWRCFHAHSRQPGRQKGFHRGAEIDLRGVDHEEAARGHRQATGGAGRRDRAALAELERFSSAMTASVEPGGPRAARTHRGAPEVWPGHDRNVACANKAALPGWRAFQARKACCLRMFAMR